MNNRMVRIALLLIACVPYAFLAVNGDAKYGTMLFYGLMVAGLTLLCWGALKTNHIPIIYIGNILSFFSSYIIAKIAGLKSMGYYFKPFTSFSLIITLSIVAIIIQTIPVLIERTRKGNSAG